MGIPFERHVIGSTEENKTFENLDSVLSTFLSAGVSRKSIVMPVGGGITSNLFGLAASLLFRGIRLVHMPTSFLNAHDAVTSMKQAVNHSGYKNIVGSFHLPSMVLCCVRIASCGEGGSSHEPRSSDMPPPPAYARKARTTHSLCSFAAL